MTSVEEKFGIYNLPTTKDVHLLADITVLRNLVWCARAHCTSEHPTYKVFWNEALRRMQPRVQL